MSLAWSLVIIWFVIALYVAFCWSYWKAYQKHQELEAKLWQYILDLEADKRALTESLCRAHGLPYIPIRNERPIGPPSDGWFDGKTEIHAG